MGSVPGRGGPAHAGGDRRPPAPEGNEFVSIRVALAGVGNCASSLVQGVTHYREVGDEEAVPGLMHTRLGPYRVRDVEFVAAFDVDSRKVGRDLAEAISAEPNNTLRFAEVPPLGVTVLRGPTADGIGPSARGAILESELPAVDLAGELRRSGAEVLVCYLPVGSERAARLYAEAALEAGVAFVNAIPVFLASDPEWAARFARAGLPIIGDDIKSQVGATITHRALARLFESRGVALEHTYQLNVGGNMDFRNMLDRDRLESKRVSKTRAVTSNISAVLPAEDVHIGPSDHVPWLGDRKVAFVRLEGSGFGGAPVALEYRLEVWDSPNSAGVIIDAIRLARLALDRGVGGPIEPACAYLMKSPPAQHPEDHARELLEAFIAGE